MHQDVVRAPANDFVDSWCMRAPRSWVQDIATAIDAIANEALAFAEDMREAGREDEL